ncbi:YihY/virulence factor BrkB family protein [Streptomyces sp. NPDC050428]|uniref:YihY/virulence factor BrkB family protein n=1 Tax=Streptomyces sp. NPDC050428 TaxID=3155757 RepID=UPI00342890B9
MDWLKKLPVVGPLVARLMLTHAWRSYETLDRAHWTRLAAAITFISFLAVFPLITVAAAIGAALLTQDRLDRLQRTLTDQVPGISDQLDLHSLVANATTVGLVAGAVLLFMGIGWVGSMRDCLRAVWGLDDAEEGNPFLRKGKDAIVLVGLGATALASIGASALGSTAIGWTADRLGIRQGGAGGVLLQIAAIVVAAVAGFLILLYVLTLLPGVQPPRRRLIVAAIIGAVGFELLKLLLGGYVRDVAGKSMYGAFGVPVALLLWINFTAKLLLFCAAWTATRGRAEPRGTADENGGGDTARDTPAGATRAGRGSPSPPPSPPPVANGPAGA